MSYKSGSNYQEQGGNKWVINGELEIGSSATFDINGAMAIDNTLTVGADGTGYDVKFYSATTGKYFYWEEAEDMLTISGRLTMAGASAFVGTVTVGVDGTGYDVKFYGDTNGKYMLWDESADKLIVVGTADLGSSCEADAYTVGGVAGADHNGVANTFTVVKGIVTAISQV